MTNEKQSDEYGSLLHYATFANSEILKDELLREMIDEMCQRARETVETILARMPK